MAWTWQYEGADGAPVDAQRALGQPPFPTQADAESWLGENWRDLLSAGVHSVTLLDGDRTVYGPMSLHPD